MTDIMSSAKRSRLMSRIRGKDTTPERYLARLLRACTLKFRRHDRSLAGCPDFTFPEAKLAVFVEGDFWHGWRFPVWKHKLSAFWQEKIGHNRHRDKNNMRRLRRRGWRVLRIWEHQVEEDVLRCLHRITSLVPRTQIDWRRVAKTLRSLPPLKRRNRLPRP